MSLFRTSADKNSMFHAGPSSHIEINDFSRPVLERDCYLLELRTALRYHERETMNVTTVQKSACSMDYPKCSALVLP